MKLMVMTAISLAMAASALAQGDPGLRISRNGAQASAKGPAQNFTGAVRVDSPFRGDGPARVSGGHVTFEPGARSAWHTHPLGQTLIITSGLGLVQRWGGPVQEVRPGDVVWIPPSEKHWHGASPNVAMSHVAIAEVQDNKAVDWLEHVSDAQYTNAR